jgi:hypothetical protein
MVDMKLDVVVHPVSDVDRAKRFYLDIERVLGELLQTVRGGVLLVALLVPGEEQGHQVAANTIVERFDTRLGVWPYS